MNVVIPPQKYNHEDFFKMAILRLRNLSKSRGIHSVFSGFNQAFREYFGEDPIKITQEMASQGKIGIRFVKRGVMIYLPGEAPGLGAELAKTALSKILNEPSEESRGLVERVLNEIAPEGVKAFPEDFLDECSEEEGMFELNVPGTQLQLDPNSQTSVTSPRRHFCYEAKNPSEAKYIVYANKVGQKSIRIPRSNKAVFKAVASYEKYCREIRDRCFSLFLHQLNDEEIAEILTREAEQKIGLKTNMKQARVEEN